MSVSIKDLKGFDFSKKYLYITKNFSLIKDGMKIDFKIEKNSNKDGEYILSYSYHSNKFGGSFSFRNPFGVLACIKNSILENERRANKKVLIIKKALNGFNPNFNEWDDLYEKLASDFNLLKLYPNYKSSKIPQDLSKKELAKYLDSMSKFELETLFMDISPIDFEIIYRNLWGEDYEYLIEKAFTSYFFGEKYYDHKILWEINKKREEFYYGFILKEFGFDVDKYDLMVPTIHSIINQRLGNTNGFIRQLQFQRIKNGENNNLEDINNLGDDFNNNFKYSRKDVDFNNLDDYKTKAKYIFILKMISINSASPIVLRYKTPKKNRDENSVQSIALKNNHIEYSNSSDLLEDYTVDKLKNVLRKYGLKLTGNKNDLIERIKENFTDDVINNEFPDRLFTLTDEGKKYLEDNYYLAEFYHALPKNFSLEEFDIICNENHDIFPDEIISCLVNEEWLIWDESLGKKPNNLNLEYKVKLKNIFKKRAKKDYYFKSIDDSVILV